MRASFAYLAMATCLAIISLGGCQSSSQTPSKTYQGVLQGEPNYLNYVPYSSAYEAQAIGLIYSSLFEIDMNDNNSLKPGLATNYEISQDRLSIRVWMRQDAVWEDGQPVTAADLEFTWRMILDPASGAQNKISDLSEIESLLVHNDFEFTARWKRPNVNALLVVAGMTPIPKHIWEGREMRDPELNRRPIGNGPWKFDEWQTGRHLSFVTNPHWWGERKPEFEKVIFRIIPEEASLIASFKKGKVDLIDSLRAITWLDFTNSDPKTNYGRLQSLSTSYGVIAWQQIGNPFFADRRVRQAMTHALDRAGILDSIYRGIGEVQNGPFYRGAWAEDPTIEPLEYDPKRAAELLDEAGWHLDPVKKIRVKDQNEFRFELLVSQGSETGQAVAIVLKSALERLGVDLQVRNLEWSVFNKRLTERDFTAALFGWNNSIDCDIYDLWHSSMQDDGLNHIGYSNPEVDHLLEAARLEFSLPERVKIAHRIHRLIHDDQPYTFLIANELLGLYNKRIVGIKTSIRGPYSAWPGIVSWRVRDLSDE